MEDHEIAALVNELTKDIKEACEGCPQCLREIVSSSVVPPLKKLQKENKWLETSLRSYEKMVSKRICYTVKELSKLKADAIMEAAGSFPSGVINDTAWMALKDYADKLEKDDD